MVVKNSGKVYAVPLDFDLGYTLCKFIDFTDIAPLTGAIVYVLNLQLKNLEPLSMREIEKLKVLFGPVPLNKYPNVKGKGSWKLIDKVEKLDDDIPVFKDTNHLITLNKATDWSTVGGWKKKYNFNEGGEYSDYESVRKLEMPFLYSMRNVEIRATMHLILLNHKKVENYYDLSDSNFRAIYIQMINTSFSKRKAVDYLKPLR